MNWLEDFHYRLLSKSVRSAQEMDIAFGKLNDWFPVDETITMQWNCGPRGAQCTAYSAIANPDVLRMMILPNKLNKTEERNWV